MLSLNSSKFLFYLPEYLLLYQIISNSTVCLKQMLDITAYNLNQYVVPCTQIVANYQNSNQIFDLNDEKDQIIVLKFVSAMLCNHLLGNQEVFRVDRIHDDYTKAQTIEVMQQFAAELQQCLKEVELTKKNTSNKKGLTKKTPDAAIQNDNQENTFLKPPRRDNIQENHASFVIYHAYKIFSNDAMLSAYNVSMKDSLQSIDGSTLKKNQAFMYFLNYATEHNFDLVRYLNILEKKTDSKPSTILGYIPTFITKPKTLLQSFLTIPFEKLQLYMVKIKGIAWDLPMSVPEHNFDEIMIATILQSWYQEPIWNLGPVYNNLVESSVKILRSSELKLDHASISIDVPEMKEKKQIFRNIPVENVDINEYFKPVLQMDIEQISHCEFWARLIGICIEINATHIMDTLDNLQIYHGHHYCEMLRRFLSESEAARKVAGLFLVSVTMHLILLVIYCHVSLLPINKLKEYISDAVIGDPNYLIHENHHEILVEFSTTLYKYFGGSVTNIKSHTHLVTPVDHKEQEVLCYLKIFRILLDSSYLRNSHLIRFLADTITHDDEEFIMQKTDSRYTLHRFLIGKRWDNTSEYYMVFPIMLALLSIPKGYELILDLFSIEPKILIDHLKTSAKVTETLYSIEKPTKKKLKTTPSSYFEVNPQWFIVCVTSILEDYYDKPYVLRYDEAYNLTTENHMLKDAFINKRKKL